MRRLLWPKWRRKRWARRLVGAMRKDEAEGRAWPDG